MLEKISKNLIPLAIIIAGLLIAGAILYVNHINQAKEPVLEEEEKSSDNKLEVLAKCLTDRGVKFYGAYWCSWCEKQKELFGETAQYLPYIECSEEKTRQMLPACQAEGITGFPTWEFDGEKTSGFKTLEQLSELSGCSL